MAEPPGGGGAAAAQARREAAAAARRDAERAAARLCAARDAARQQVSAALAAGDAPAPLALPDDLWRVPLPGGAEPHAGDAAAAAAAGRPSPDALWGAAGAALAAAGAPARERLERLLGLCRQVCDAERSVATQAQRVEAAALARADAALCATLRGRAASPPPVPHGAAAALRDWHAAALAAAAKAAAAAQGSARATPALDTTPEQLAASLRAADCRCFDVTWQGSGGDAASDTVRVTWSTRRRGVVARVAAAAPAAAPLSGLRLECGLADVAGSAPFWLATRGDPAAFSQQVLWPAMDAREAHVAALAAGGQQQEQRRAPDSQRQ